MHILIVDDIPLNLRLLNETLEIEGHTTVSARDGIEALSILEKDRFDVIITDILMPGMDGYRLCKAIRSQDKLTDLKVIMYSSTYTSMADENVAYRFGADMFLRKPAPHGDLV